MKTSCHIRHFVFTQPVNTKFTIRQYHSNDEQQITIPQLLITGEIGFHQKSYLFSDTGFTETKDMHAGKIVNIFEIKKYEEVVETKGTIYTIC